MTYPESARAVFDSEVTAHIEAVGGDPTEHQIRVVAGRLVECEAATAAALGGLRTSLGSPRAIDRVDPSQLTGAAALLIEYRTLHDILRRMVAA